MTASYLYTEDKMAKLLFLMTVFMLVGCSGQQRENNDLAEILYQHPPSYVLQELQEIDFPERDYAQFHLNLGFLLLISGQFEEAISTLSTAKKEMAVLQASSISENFGAGTINETLRSYSGYPTDRVMVHNMLALSYLFNDDIDSARVEMLQADISMKKLTDGVDLNGQLASAHLLSAIIYELLDEQSNALISYKKASDIIEERNLPLPSSLQKALLRMSFKLGAKSQYASYKKRFPALPEPTLESKNQLFALYFDGIVSHKIENSITVPNTSNNQWIRISMPTYPRKNRNINRAKINTSGAQIVTELVESIDQLARDDLEREYPSILLLTTTRAIAKYQLVKEAEEEDPLLGILVNLATVLTEVADLRSWNMLPATIQFAYIETTENKLPIETLNNATQNVIIKNNSQNVVLINSLSDQVFHYQQ